MKRYILVALMVIGCGTTKKEETKKQENIQVQVEQEEQTKDLAELGRKLFHSKGCNACHTIGGGKLVGPDLKGITEKRDEDWLIGMIVNPDSMFQHDSLAKELLKEFGTRMPNQGVSVEEAKAILEYIRKQS